MRHLSWVLSAAALLLALTAAVCLYAGSRLPSGVSAADTAVGELFSPGKTPGPAALSMPEDEGGHTHAVAAGGSAALLLTGRKEGGRGLAVELARRGVTALTVPESVSAGDAWDWLTSREFVRLNAAALIAGPSRGEEALALASELSGGGRECAALVLSGGDGLLNAAADCPARNILFLTPEEPAAEAAAAFLGDGEGPGKIRGYFAEGTARSAVPTGTNRLDDREALLPVIDWLGSSLGHTVELHDEDLIIPGTRTMQTAAELLLAAAAGSAAVVLGMIRADRKKRNNSKKGISS